MWPLIFLCNLPLYTLYYVLVIPVYLSGWVLVALASACGAYEMTDPNINKPADGPIYHFTWKFMYLWDNTNDGIANKNYYVAPNIFLQIMYWSCLRNPVDNLRTAPFFSFKLDPTKVSFRGTFGDYDAGSTDIPKDINLYDTKVPQWFFAWQGLRSNLYVQFELNDSLYRFWIGSGKIYPTTILQIPDYLKEGSSSVLQFKKVN